MLLSPRRDATQVTGFLNSGALRRDATWVTGILVFTFYFLAAERTFHVSRVNTLYYFSLGEKKARRSGLRLEVVAVGIVMDGRF